MSQKIPCPKCGQILSVADDSPNTSRSCPKCQAPIDVPDAKTTGEAAELALSEISDSAPNGNCPGKWMGSRSPGVHPVLFRFLFPLLTVSCVTAIVDTYLNAKGDVFRRLFAYVTHFFFLDMLVAAQILYWAPWPEPLRMKSCLIVGTLAGLTALAAVIFLFVSCSFLAGLW